MKIQDIYRLAEGANVWTFTSGDTPIDFNGETYVPKIVGRTEPESKNELSKANIELSLSIDDELALRYRSNTTDALVTLTIWTKQDADFLVIWKGRMASTKPQDQIFKIVFESIFTSMRRPGLRRRFQRNCGHMLYGRGCFVNKELFGVDGTTATVVGAIVTSAAAATKPDGYFSGGILKAPDGTLRYVVRHVGTSLLLARPIASLSVGNAVRLYPGCDRTRGTCQNTFNNLANNGSFPFIPIRNPFTGNSFA